MKVLITGVCGFVGSTLAKSFAELQSGWTIYGIDNLSRPGAEVNRALMRRLGIKFIHADLRSSSDVDPLPAVDWVIDAAANPSVLAGTSGSTSSRQLMEHNLFGTANVLEFCKQNKSGLILLSTSRVYSIPALSALTMVKTGKRFAPDSTKLSPDCSRLGIGENFSTAAPVSLYGATKLASEALALEYGKTFDFPVWINRCGVMAGGGQFGRPDQGIYAYWINSHLRRSPLRYIGFGGNGYQVRDCLHPRDLAALIAVQVTAGSRTKSDPQIIHVSGGIESSMSLAELTDWCNHRFGDFAVQADTTPRPFDLPWIVLDPGQAKKVWNWTPTVSTPEILEEIALHAIAHPDWLFTSAPE